MAMLDLLPKPPPGKIGWPWTEEVSPSVYCSNMKWPRVSIVMPSYNQRSFIEESIRSVLLQNYPDLEFIIYDGCSSDGSDEIIKRYGPWLTHWAVEPDQGQSHAINKGLQRCTGKYFNWHNSDDILTPGSLAKCVTALSKHPEASHAHGCRKVIFADGSIHSSSEKDYGPPTRLAPDTGKSIATLKTGTQPGCLMERELVVKVGGLAENLHFAMDIDILLKLSVLKPPLYVHEELIWYRIHDQTKSHNEWPAERKMEKLIIAENIFRMPEAQKYLSFRKSAFSTGRVYAAHCCWKSRNFFGFLRYYLQDVLYAPVSGVERRKALIYYLRQKQ